MTQLPLVGNFRLAGRRFPGGSLIPLDPYVSFFAGDSLPCEAETADFYRGRSASEIAKDFRENPNPIDLG